jgi:hypothetical protein
MESGEWRMKNEKNRLKAKGGGNEERGVKSEE